MSVSRDDTREVENRRYNYLIETELYRICHEENNPDECHRATAHVERARKFGMLPEAIWERLSNDSWYDDTIPPKNGEGRLLPPMGDG